MSLSNGLEGSRFTPLHDEDFASKNWIEYSSLICCNLNTTWHADMNIETIREFLGWCTVINIGVLAFSSIMVIALQGAISKIHQKMFGLDEAAVHQAYFRYLANYKIAIIVFNLVPYIALKIMA